MIAAEPVSVAMAFSAFTPAEVRVLAGDTVTWHNASSREHTVKGGDFASPKLGRFGSFSHTFTALGDQRYVCTIHIGMSGQVDVEPILLEAPSGPVAEGRPIALMGRAQAGVEEVYLERDTGRGFTRLATAAVHAGAFRVTAPPGPSGTYRAVAEDLVSPAVVVRVLGQQVRASARRGRISVDTLPARPGGTVVLQLRLRERFGWWPVAMKRLDRRGRGTFVLSAGGPVPARVVLTGRAGAAALATSRAVRIGRHG